MTRDYKREYATYHSKPVQKKRRAERNASRAKAEKDGRVSKGDGKDVDHVTHNTASSKTRVTTASANRSRNLGRGGRPKGTTTKGKTRK